MDENFEQEKIQPKSSLKSSPITMTLIALGTVFVLYQFFGAGLALLLFGELDEENVQGFRLITMFSQFMFIFVPTLIFARWQETEYKEIFKLKNSNFTRDNPHNSWNFIASKHSPNLSLHSRYFATD